MFAVTSSRLIATGKTTPLQADAPRSSRPRSTLPHSLLLELVSLGHAQELVDAMQPRKVIPLPAIEEAALPEIDVKKAQQRRETAVLATIA